MRAAEQLGVGGRNFGSGSSRDWAAKGQRVLGVRAIIAESFERIHRCNLIDMGILPLQIPAGQDRRSLRLQENETIDLAEPDGEIQPNRKVRLIVHAGNGTAQCHDLICRADTR